MKNCILFEFFYLFFRFLVVRPKCQQNVNIKKEKNDNILHSKPGTRENTTPEYFLHAS